MHISFLLARRVPQTEIFRPISNKYVSRHSRGQSLFYGICDHLVLSVFTLYFMVKNKYLLLFS